MSQSRRHLFALAILVSAAITSTGCVKSLFPAAAGKQANPFQNAGAAGRMMQPPAIGGPSCTVAIYSKGARPKEVKLPVTGQMFVQEALNKSGVSKRFNRMKVVLIRPRPYGKGRHKMDIKFRSGKKRVSLNSDYAIHPGDRLVVIEDNSTAFDDMIDKVTEPLGHIADRGHSHSH